MIRLFYAAAKVSEEVKKIQPGTWKKFAVELFKQNGPILRCLSDKGPHFAFLSHLSNFVGTEFGRVLCLLAINAYEHEYISVVPLRTLVNWTKDEYLTLGVRKEREFQYASI